ncbi:MAG: hypothetical protein HY582_00415 [Candidatus Omnitrophica bacterium]|nr:hypothetical protein [Candidatus Omnitrophota bacterium]
MNQENHLIWSAEKESSQTESYIFCYDKTTGFTDIDFHPISGDGWKKFKSSNSNQTATLVVSPAIAVEDLTKALQELKRRTSFERIKIDVKKN